MGRVCCMTGTAVKMNPHRCPGYRSSAAPRATPLRCAASSAALCVLGRLLPSSKAECLCPGPACAAKTGSAPPWGALRLAAVLDALAGGCPAAWLVTTCTLSQNGYPFRIFSSKMPIASFPCRPVLPIISVIISSTTFRVKGGG